MISQPPIALLPIRATVGDVEGNVRQIIHAVKQAVRQDPSVALCVAPELCISGYPVYDLVWREGFLSCCWRGVERLSILLEGISTTVVIGCPIATSHSTDQRAHNAVIILVPQPGKPHETRVGSVKTSLPNYGVFNDARTFVAPRDHQKPLVLQSGALSWSGIVCEDMWSGNTVKCCVDLGAQLICVLNGSPFEPNKRQQRLNIAEQIVHHHKVCVAYVNLLGGQDGLIFDGHSFFMQPDRSTPLNEQMFSAEPLWCGSVFPTKPTSPDPITQTYAALVLGLRDYVVKNGFTSVLLGLSGGIDSALVATLAVDALGTQNVEVMALPTRFNSSRTRTNAKHLAQRLGLRLHQRPIDALVMIAHRTYQPEPEERDLSDLSYQNLQARIRGMLLMTHANQTGSLLLTTGNKSEIAVGYTTLYGDSCGGYAPIADLYKTDVYRLSRWRNALDLDQWPLDPKLQGPTRPIPEDLLATPPSAELSESQQDSDTLPPYEILDPLLRTIIDAEEIPSESISDPEHWQRMLSQTARQVDKAEHKRRQMPPCTKITKMTWNSDRIVPITNRFYDNSPADPLNQSGLNPLEKS